MITREVYALFDPYFKAYSLDEASLHLTPYLAKHPDESPEQVAEKVRALVKERTQLTCSIGKYGLFSFLFVSISSSRRRDRSESEAGEGVLRCEQTRWA